MNLILKHLGQTTSEASHWGKPCSLKQQKFFGHKSCQPPQWSLPDRKIANQSEFDVLWFSIVGASYNMPKKDAFNDVCLLFSPMFADFEHLKCLLEQMLPDEEKMVETGTNVEHKSLEGPTYCMSSNSLDRGFDKELTQCLTDHVQKPQSTVASLVLVVLRSLFGLSVFGLYMIFRDLKASHRKPWIPKFGYRSSLRSEQEGLWGQFSLFDEHVWDSQIAEDCEMSVHAYSLGLQADWVRKNWEISWCEKAKIIKKYTCHMSIRSYIMLRVYIYIYMLGLFNFKVLVYFPTTINHHLLRWF